LLHGAPSGKVCFATPFQRGGRSAFNSRLRQHARIRTPKSALWTTAICSGREAHPRLVTVLGLLLAATFMGAMNQDEVPDVIRARGFEVTGRDGRALASLSQREYGSVTLEFDGPGDGRLSVGVDRHDALGIILSDRRKVGRVVIGLDGTAGDPFLYLLG